MRVDYGCDIFIDDEWHANLYAHTPEALLSEANHAILMYAESGEVRVDYYKRTNMSEADMRSETREARMSDE